MDLDYLNNRELLFGILTEIQKRYYALPNEEAFNPNCSEIIELRIMKAIANRWLGYTCEFNKLINQTRSDKVKEFITLSNMLKNIEVDL